MKALKIDRVTPGADAELTDIPVLAVKPGWALVKVQAFGLNNSERLVRLEEIGKPWIAPAVVPGIECAGTVADPGDTDLSPGQRVVACMGGMGREFDGSYAEYALLPRKNIVRVPADIDWPWAQLGAFPETYLTAWGSLFECPQRLSCKTPAVAASWSLQSFNCRAGLRLKRSRLATSSIPRSHRSCPSPEELMNGYGNPWEDAQGSFI